MSTTPGQSPRGEGSGALTGQSYLDRLQAWAEDRGLRITTTGATQFEPYHLVAVVRADDRLDGVLIKRESRDSIESAAFYLVNTLELLGVNTGG